MTITAGTKLGPYEILSLLGAGGMGEVYRAKDVRVDRAVALKVLPEEFFEGEERRQRFEREARMLASLNHPGIAVLYSFEEIPSSSSSSSSSPTRHLLVMELVEGDDLSVRVARGPLPLEESLSFARQIAEALEAAHEKGIVHRDLKPANVKITQDGRVKLLDFGLAKIFESEATVSNPSISYSPTLTARGTAAGVILGTAAYMSPEQARGKPVDKRTDVWAFGCVLYEMLAGKRAFEGETVSDTLAAILRGEPDWSALRAPISSKVNELLRRCLQRDAKQRLRDIGDARIALEEETAAAPSSSRQLPFEENLHPPSPSPTVGRSASAGPERGSKKSLSVFLPWAIAAAFAAAAGALALRARAPRAPAPVVQFEVRVPEGATFGNSMALSPDGRRLAFVATDEKDIERLYVRSLDSVAVQLLSGTEGARFPFWSPDGKAIAYFTGDRLARVSATGGPPQTICPVTDGRGGTWFPRGVIVFAPGTRLPLHRVSATGGIPVAATKFGAKDYSHRWPRLLPDGVHYLYHCMSDDPARLGTRVASLDSEGDAFLVSTRGKAEYDAGRLLYVRESALYSHPFDAGRRVLSGEPELVAEGVVVEGESGWTGLAAFSAADGTLVHRRRANPRQKLTWFDRSGKPLGTVGDAGVLSEPFWFPGAQRLGLSVMDPRTELYDLWQVDLARGTWTRLTFGPKANNTGMVSPDGKNLYFSSNRASRMGLFRRPLDGTGGDEPTLSTTLDNYGDFISPDGAWLVFETMSSVGRPELWRLPLSGERKPELLLAVPQAATAHASGSPDGKFFAYTSDETGRSEVYVQRFPPSGGKWQISKDGGDQALWRADGKELYFLSIDRKIMAVELSLGGDAQIGAPKALFSVRVPANGISDNRSQYLPAPDGNRFLVLATADEKQDQPAVVVLNWTSMGGAPR